MGVQLKPATQFGPMDGAARGEFGPLCLYNPSDFTTLIIATERFVEAVRRLGYEQDILFREVPVS